MQVTYRNGPCEFLIEVQTVKAAFEAVAGLREVFTGEPCGCCKKTNVVPEVRESKGYTFYSLRCLDCRAQLDFGQHKEGGELFAKRWDKDAKRAMADNGWYMYKENGQREEAPATDLPENNMPPWGSEIQDYHDWLEGNPPLKAVNAEIEAAVSKLPEGPRKAVGKMFLEYGKRQGWEYDPKAKKFKEVARV